MDGPRCIYLEGEDVLLLKNLEPGNAEVRIPGNILKIVLRRTREGFKLFLSTLKGEATVKMLVLENSGPGVLSVTEGLPRIWGFRLSWDGRSLKIMGLKLSEKPVELNLILVPVDLNRF
ncbi:MAG: hypothetical protein FGF53_03615 [Candidatus Brockarchaeota archaeon]|nr:hypothetical protein [Candidatus Brockarchaeota archaeon]MBO3809277.1 hypothetical protein [Candidatus Brockarchaeota archaeon]